MKRAMLAAALLLSLTAQTHATTSERCAWCTTRTCYRRCPMPCACLHDGPGARGQCVLLDSRWR